MKQINEVIGRSDYLDLKILKDPDPKQAKKIHDYERAIIEAEKERLLKVDKYFTEIFKDGVAEPPKFFTVPELMKIFKEQFYHVQGDGWRDNEESEIKLTTLAAYFCRDDRFFKSPILSDVTKPSFTKGLLVIGSYGNGKSSMMKTLEKIFKGLKGYHFQTFTANEVVDLYEGCQLPGDKEYFWRRMEAIYNYYDDVKTEREASNYGKANLIKDILEKRYTKNVKTHITCNYKESDPDNLDAGLKEFGEKYGSRVYDRLFEMFNVIEFKGKSFRK